MSAPKARRARKFFRRLYVPALVKAGNVRARRLSGLAIGGERQKNGRANFANVTPEERRAYGHKGGSARWAKASEIERLAIKHHLAEQRKRQPKAVRVRIATAGGRARWERYSPEERAAELVRFATVGAGATILRTRAEWPFPKMCPECGVVLATWKSKRCRKCTCKTLNVRVAAKRAFGKRKPRRVR